MPEPTADASWSWRAIAQGLRAGLPVAAGYFPVAFSFALAALQAGLAAWQAVMISVFVYAGAAQFVLVSLIAAGGSGLGAVLAIGLLNARHLFYGPALLSTWQARLTPGQSWFLGAGLTDEVFGTAMGAATRLCAADRPSWLLGLELAAYAAWVGGTVTGVLVGVQAVAQAGWLAAALEFILPALFFTLLIDVWATGARLTVAATVALTAVLSTWLPGHLALVLGMLGGGMLHATLSQWAPALVQPPPQRAGEVEA